MDDAQIILSLLNFYRSEGLDLHNLLDDPIFNTLSLPTKVQMIKTYAADIAAGIKPRLRLADFKDNKSDFVRSAIAGGLAGLGAIKALGMKPHPLAVAAAATTGLTIGSGLSAFRRMNEVHERHAIRDKLNEINKNPSDENALQLLALRGYQTRSRPERTRSLFQAIEEMRGISAESSKNVAVNTMKDIQKLKDTQS
jgi:hypothetical protein